MLACLRARLNGVNFYAALAVPSRTAGATPVHRLDPPVQDSLPSMTTFNVRANRARPGQYLLDDDHRAAPGRHDCGPED